METDTELINTILSGDMRALEKLMRLYNRTLYRAARAILRDDAEAEDAVQEAWLKAYRSLASFRGASRLSTWLVRIAVNEALVRCRRARPVDYGPVEDRAADEPGPELQAQRREAARLLEVHIDALPDRYREVFVLRGLEEFNVEETAAALGIPDATVRTRYFRARRLLREWMRRDLVRPVLAFAGAVLAAATLAACGEKPPRAAPDDQAVHDDAGFRDRTLQQGESHRMSY